jgi:septum formation protein
MTLTPFWLADKPLVLASGSAARRTLLDAAAIPIEVRPVPIDERTLASKALSDGADPLGIAECLAAAKASAAAKHFPGRVILAADQTLELAGQLMMKAPDFTAARAQLAQLRGRMHQLHSAAILLRDNEVLWAGSRSASLQMRAFSEAFLNVYLDAMGTRLLETVGGYQLEALGAQLFDLVEGDHATILGLPLSDILAALRKAGLLLD